MKTYNAALSFSIITSCLLPSHSFAATQLNPNPNNATINVTSPTYNELNFINNGVIAIQGSGSLDNLNIIDNRLAINNVGLLSNHAIISNNIGSIDNHNQLLNYATLINNVGTIYNHPNSYIVNLPNGVISNNYKSQLINEGMLSLQGGSHLINSGTIYSYRLIESGAQIQNLGHGQFNILKGITQSEFNNGYLFENTDSSTLNNSGTINNSGSIKNSGTSLISNSATIKNTGIIYNETSSTITNTGSIQNSATIQNEGTLKGTGTLSQNKGTFVNNGTLEQTDIKINGGTLTGNGLIKGNVQLSAGALLNPGKTVGKMTIQGNLTSSGDSFFDFSGKNANQFDFLQVTGATSFNAGTLHISFTDGFHATAGDTWEFLSSSSINGWNSLSCIFSGLDPNLIGSIGLANNGNLSVTVSAVPEPETYAMLAAGLALLLVAAKRKRLPI